MTTATTATWELNRDERIRFGLHMCGVLNAAASPSPEQIALGKIFLSDDMLALQLRGKILRCVERTEKAITVGMTSFTCDADTLDVEAGAVLRDSSNFDRPMEKVFLPRWQNIGDKSTTGAPSWYYAEEGAGGAIAVNLFPVPSEAFTMIYPRVKRTRDLSSGTVTLDAPVSWGAAIGWMLAWKFSVHYKQSLERNLALKSFYDEYMRTALDDETPRGGVSFVAESIISR